MKPDKLILSVLGKLKDSGMKMFYGLLVLLVVVDVFVPKEEGAFTGHTWVGFYAFFGFLGAMLTTAFWKGLSKIFLHKKDDYYD